MTERSMFDLTEQMLATAQGKITYLGEQKKPIPTVVFSTLPNSIVMDRFLPWQRSIERYDNDYMPYTVTFIVTPIEFTRIIKDLEPVIITKEVGDGLPFLSFTVIWRDGGQFIGHETRIGYASGKEFYKILANALEPGNQAGRAALSRQETACYPKVK